MASCICQQKLNFLSSSWNNMHMEAVSTWQ